MFRAIFLISILLCCSSALAKEGGVAFDGAIGLPALTLTNPDGSKAAYEGLSLQGRLYLPIYEEASFGIFTQGVLRYYDLENNFSSDSGTEVANHIGPGLGITFKFGRLSLGYEYMLMRARHYYIGNIGSKTEFNYSVGNAFAGITIPFGALAIGVSYGMGAGKVPKSETDLSKDSDYSEQTIWFHLTYSTGVQLGNFAKSLVKK